MATYGKTWWGKKWLETFTGIDYDNRLPRGRTYANTGRAYDIKIQENIITAKVQGSRPRPYTVKVILKSFNQIEKESIHNVIVSSPSILAALIDKKLSSLLLEKLHENNINLFPSNWEEVEASCSCPDWAMPCKHIAAVIYLIGAEIDKNPFMVFRIHDCDLLNLIGDFNEGKLEHVQKIGLIEDLFQSGAHKDFPFDQSILDGMNFSKISDLSSYITTILRDDPSFYEKNFREVLYLSYKYWQLHPHGKIKHSLYSHPITSKTKIKKELSEEEIFIEKWHSPEQWDSFNLAIDDTHRLTGIFNQDVELFHSSSDLTSALTRFLEEMPNALLHKLCPELRFAHMLFQFAIKLMEKSALIPQILQNKKGETLIRWLPALFDQEVRQVYCQLCSSCPKGLVQYKKVVLHSEEQVKTAVAMILSGLMKDNLPISLDRNRSQNVFQLFFLQKSYTFTEFTNRELPAAINQWLYNLYLSEREHKLYLMVEDKEEKFELALQLSLDEKKAPVPLQQVLQTKDSDVKLSILSDLSMISEHIPELAYGIDNGITASFDLDAFTPLLLRIFPVLKAIGVGVILPKSLQRMLKPQLSLRLKSKDKIQEDPKSFLNLTNLLDFDWQIAIGDKTLSIAAFKNMLKESRGLIRLVNEYVFLEEKEIQALLKQLEKLPDHLSQADLMQAMLAGELNGANVDTDEQLNALLHQLEKCAPVSIPKNLKAQLRPYQEQGFNWLIQNIEIGFGSILADDMGLGKTLQVITAILHLKNKGCFNMGQRVLIVAPTSLLSNWQKEIKKFAPDLTLWIYHGQNRELANEYDVLITSYGLVRRDKKELDKMKWLLLIIDEAQNIKNPNTEQTKAIKSIKAQHKIAMSGTPVENRMLEYWSIFDFTNKHYLGTPKQFQDRYASPIEKERNKDCLDRFKKITTPFILRRLKNDKSIIADLPDKIETNRYCSLTSEQAALYQEVVDISVKKIEESEGIERKGLILQLINSLKQICNHPSQFSKKKRAHIEQSGKMEMLEEILLAIDNTAEKSLIFTQYTEMGKIIAHLIGERLKTQVPFLHGGLSLKARDEMVYDFQNSSNVRTLIVSLKAGGTGLNLTAASHVIHYDLWWNPAVEAQATDRAYRIGQKRNVIVHRLLTTGTFEELIDEMIKSKKELANLTVGSGENWITEMSTEQIKDLISLKKMV